MPKTRKSCCGKEGTCLSATIPAVPPPIQEELDRTGGFDALEKSLPPAKEIDAVSRRYHALSDPHRLKIVYLLCSQPLCVCVIKRFLQISDSKLSYHLTILKESGLVTCEYHGNWNIYSLTETGKKYVQ